MPIFTVRSPSPIAGIKGTPGASRLHDPGAIVADHSTR